MRQESPGGVPDDRTLLYIDKRVPTHDRDAGSAITRHYLELLSEIGFQITFWPHDRVPREPYTSQLREMGIEVHAGRSSLRDCLAKASREIDVVCIARPDVAVEHMDVLKESTRAHILYIAHDLHFLRYQRMHEVVGGVKPQWWAWRMERIELKVMRRCDTTVVFSPVEKEILWEMDPSLDVKVWPWVQEPVFQDGVPRRALDAALSQVSKGGGHPPEGEAPGFDERWGTVFVGSFAHAPNEDAVLWFAEEVLPLVRRSVPEAGFGVIGAHPPAKVAALGSPFVKVLGFVPDLTRYLNAARVFVASLRYGAGIKGKILTAMAHGLPVVTTGIGAEGIGVENEREVLVADTPEDFAEAVVTLHDARGLWKRLSRESLDFVRRRASREYARVILKADLAALLGLAPPVRLDAAAEEGTDTELPPTREWDISEEITGEWNAGEGEDGTGSP